MRAGAESAVRSFVGGWIAQLERHHGPQGVLARAWPTGSTVLWVTVMLAAFLVLYYL